MPGCPYYVGLNGLELYDEHQRAIAMGEGSVAAQPESINVIPSVAARGGDARVLNNLYDARARANLHRSTQPLGGVMRFGTDRMRLSTCVRYDGLNDTYDDDHMWLTPWDANDQV
jgi:hypothetical protein